MMLYGHGNRAHRYSDDLYSEKEKYFDYTESLALITAKTLIVVGEKDWICPPGNIKIRPRIPDKTTYSTNYHGKNKFCVRATNPVK